MTYLNLELTKHNEIYVLVETPKQGQKLIITEAACFQSELPQCMISYRIKSYLLNITLKLIIFVVESVEELLHDTLPVIELLSGPIVLQTVF